MKFNLVQIIIFSGADSGIQAQCNGKQTVFLGNRNIAMVFFDTALHILQSKAMIFSGFLADMLRQEGVLDLIKQNLVKGPQFRWICRLSSGSRETASMALSSVFPIIT